MADFSSARINQRPPPYHPLWACKCKCRHRHRRAVNFALRISPHQAVDLTTNISAQPDQDQPEQPSRPDPVFHTRAARRQKTPVTGARGSTHLDAPLCAQKPAWPGCWSGRLGSTQTGLAASVGPGGHCIALHPAGSFPRDLAWAAVLMHPVAWNACDTIACLCLADAKQVPHGRVDRQIPAQES